mmetsp:Transcript_71608/g.213701  ORF Transcript_71608/g.213701 Transcript_71608/m.213701 type:complete len:268 (-) Transcript_71608:530-1333(-)
MLGQQLGRLLRRQLLRRRHRRWLCRLRGLRFRPSRPSSRRLPWLPCLRRSRRGLRSGDLARVVRERVKDLGWCRWRQCDGPLLGGPLSRLRPATPRRSLHSALQGRRGGAAALRAGLIAEAAGRDDQHGREVLKRAHDAVGDRGHAARHRAALSTKTQLQERGAVRKAQDLQVPRAGVGRPREVSEASPGEDDLSALAIQTGRLQVRALYQDLRPVSLPSRPTTVHEVMALNSQALTSNCRQGDLLAAAAASGHGRAVVEHPGQKTW